MKALVVLASFFICNVGFSDDGHESGSRPVVRGDNSTLPSASGSVSLNAKLVGASSDPKAEVATAEITVTNGILNLKSCAQKNASSDRICSTVSVPAPKLFSKGGMEEGYSNYLISDSTLLVVNDKAMGQKIIPKYTLLFGYSVLEHNFKEAIELVPNVDLQVK